MTPGVVGRPLRQPRRLWQRLRPLRPLLATLIVIAASACTGTFREGAPLVLLVAAGPDDAPSQVLAFLMEPPGPATPRRVTPLATADLAPDLTLPLRAWDWVDRDALAAGPGRGRTRLIALAGAAASTSGARSAMLHRYDVAAFGLDAPALTPVGAPITLVAGGRWNDVGFPVAPGVTPPLEGVCLVGVSVDAIGRYAALLDRRAACRAAEAEVFLHVVDLVEPQLVWSSTPADVAPVRPFVDQRENALDVWLRTPGGFDWHVLDLATRSLSPRVQTATGTALVDASPSGDARWALLDGRLQVVTPASIGAPGAPSAGGADRRFVDTAPGLAAVIVGGNDLVVHADPSQPALSPVARRYRDGVTDVPDQLSYLLRPGAIDTLDLLLLVPAEPLTRVLSEVYRDGVEAPLLSQPRRITMFRPRPPPLP
jgi:hypothetical protein